MHYTDTRPRRPVFLAPKRCSNGARTRTTQLRTQGTRLLLGRLGGRKKSVFEIRIFYNNTRVRIIIIRRDRPIVCPTCDIMTQICRKSIPCTLTLLSRVIFFTWLLINFKDNPCTVICTMSQWKLYWFLISSHEYFGWNTSPDIAIIRHIVFRFKV